MMQTPETRNPAGQGGASRDLLGVGARGTDNTIRFNTQREAALALLNGETRLSRKAGQFLGQLSVDPSPMSGGQSEWLAKLLNKAGLPPLAGESVQ